MTTLTKCVALIMAFQVATKPPTLHLTGDTRACHGRFDLTAKTLSWQSTWSRCTLRSMKQIASDANVSAFQIEPTKTCPFTVVETINVTQRDGLPATDYPLYMVNGFKTVESFHQHRDKPELSCNMQ